MVYIPQKKVVVDLIWTCAYRSSSGSMCLVIYIWFNMDPHLFRRSWGLCHRTSQSTRSVIDTVTSVSQVPLPRPSSGFRRRRERKELKELKS